MNKKVLTLCLIQKDNKVLLGFKKRGFGKNKWNGFGGKLHSGETIEQAAIREVKEESNINVLNIKKIGILTFKFLENGEEFEGHIFKSIKFNGTPLESDEMKPKWFKVDQIPFDKMWSDDIYWFPLFLQNKKFIGYFNFDSQENITKYSLKEVDEIL